MDKFCNGATCFIAGALIGPPVIIYAVKFLIWGIEGWGAFTTALARSL